MSKQEEIAFVEACYQQAKVLKYDYAIEMFMDIYAVFARNTRSDILTKPYREMEEMREDFDCRIKNLTTNLQNAQQYAADWERRAIVLEQKLRLIHQASSIHQTSTQEN